MKVLIDIPDEDYKWLKGLKAKGRRLATKEEAVANGIALDGLTNGEVMQMLLSNAELHWTNECEYGLRPLDSNWIIWFKGDWWNRKWGETE